MIPNPTPSDLERDAEADMSRLNGYGPTSPQGRIAQWWASWIRRCVAAEQRCRDHHLEPCETCIANETARIAAERLTSLCEATMLVMEQKLEAAERERDEARDRHAKWCAMSAEQMEACANGLIERNRRIAELEAENARLKEKADVLDCLNEINGVK